MDHRPDMYVHNRAEIRLRVRARALYRTDDCRGGGRVRNLSAGGVEISKPDPMPVIGDSGQVMLVSDENVRLGPLKAEVVRETATGVAFKFTNVDRSLRARILSALQSM